LMNTYTGEMETFKKTIEEILQSMHTNGLAATDRMGLLSTALSGVEDKTFDMNKILAIKPKTLGEIVKAQGMIEVLNLQINTLFANNSLDEATAVNITGKIKAAEKTIAALLKPFGEATGEAAKTAIEKVMEALSNSGFSMAIEEVGTFDATSLGNLSKKYTEQLALKKKLAKLPLIDEDARRATVLRLTEIDKEIQEILTFEQSGNNFALDAILGNQGGMDLASFYSMGDGFEPMQQQYLANLTHIKDVEIKLANSRGEQAAGYAKQLRELENAQNALIDNAVSASATVVGSIGSSITKAIKEDMSLSNIFDSVLDTLSNTIIETVVNSFVTAFVTASGLDSFFTNMFSGLGSMFHGEGSKLGKKTTDGLKESIDSEGGFFSGLFDSLPEGMQTFFGTIKDGFSSVVKGFGEGLGKILGGSGGGLATMLGNVSGGDGFFSSIAGSIGGFLGFSNGGIVPNTSYSRAGRDSVPAMLTPGELVVPQNKIDDVLNGRASGSSGGGSATFNLNIQGDVTRQTRKEIVRMMPEIANGVNNNNKENNFRG